MRIAIMQPYFAPYAGYFRLFDQTDLFVMYDCVQFPRRGWVHRNKMKDRNQQLQWVTLPIKKAPRNILIKDLEFAEAPEDFTARFPALQSFDTTKLKGSVASYLIGHLQEITQALNIPFKIVRSSELNISPEYKAQDRILEICKHLGATSYLNAPGGKDLYDAQAFEKHNIDLSFLPPYDGNMHSILQEMVEKPVADIRKEILYPKISGGD
ncbi:MAG: WbqC family protein [Alphaproteobacteria bacterium]